MAGAAVRARMGRMVVTAGLAGGLSAACLGCSSGDGQEVGATSIVSSVTTATSVSTSTVAPIATSTTVSPLEQDRREVFEVHTRFMTEFFKQDERVDVGLVEAERMIRKIATGAQLERSLAALAELGNDAYLSIGPGNGSNVTEIRIDGDRADVIDCSQDLLTRVPADGEVIVPADDFFEYRQVVLVRTSSGWKVEDFLTGGDERCNPDELQVLSF